MVAIPFTGNYEDLSTDRGFQFKFYCEKCRNGYMSSFQTSAVGVLGSAARAAGSLFGGFFGNVADSSYEVQRAVGGSAHDSALKDAVAEISPIFKQCTRCGQWVCKPICWNEKAGLCETCAPDLDEEMAAAQAEAAREQIQANRSPAPSAPPAARRRRARSSAPSAARTCRRSASALGADTKRKGLRRSSVLNVGRSIEYAVTR